MSDKNTLVYKSNELIEGRYALSAVAQKLAASVISRVDPRGEDPLPKFKMTIPELSELSGIQKEVLYRTIGSYTKELQAIVIEIRKIGSNDYRQLGLFREFEFDSNKRILSIEFEGRLEEHIRDFSGNFTRYQMIQLRELNSKYAIRLYEILRKAHNMNKPTNSVTVYEQPLESLRLMLGVKTTAYKNRFDLFRRNVIEVAKSELREKTDLQFEFENIRHGRKIGAVKFFIRHNERFEQVDETAEGQLLLPEVDESMLGMVKLMLPDVEDRDAVLLVAGYTKEELTEALMDLSRAALKTKVEDHYQYLLGILKNKRKLDTGPCSTSSKDKYDRSWADNTGEG